MAEQCAEHNTKIERNADDIQELWSAIDDIKKALQYRLPLWATFLISLLTGAVGSLLTALLKQ